MRPGDVIDGKYRIETILGEGGMGVVFAATHTTIGNTVAIKVLRPEAMRSPEVPARFRREATNMGMLRSEHVIRVIDVGQLQTGEPFMVMEMLHGTDLGSRLKQGPVPPHQAVDYIMQACEGLAEAHAKGMVHRDIKPANLFVTSRPNGTALVKVLDFGIATAASGSVDPRLTSTQSVMGSPSYMSPEQLKGARDVDARSDVWSLGVTLYELITGNQPFSGNTLTALSLAIVTDAHERPVNMPASIIPIVDKCLDKERERRYQNVAELAQALAPLFPGGTVAAEMVRGSYSQPVPPTLHGLEASQLLGSQATMLPPARATPSTLVPANSLYSANGGMTSTTSLAAGETGTSIPTKSRKWVWLTAGIATIALGVGVGIVVGRGNNNEAAASKPPVATEPTTPPPTSTPIPEPPKTVEQKPEPPPPQDPPKVEDPPKDPPVVAVDPKRPPKRPGRPPKRPGDKRLPVEPPDYKNPVKDPPKVDPPKVDPPKVDPPKVDPKKQPCAPNDPKCGL